MLAPSDIPAWRYSFGHRGIAYYNFHAPQFFGGVMLGGLYRKLRSWQSPRKAGTQRQVGLQHTEGRPRPDEVMLTLSDYIQAPAGVESLVDLLIRELLPVALLVYMYMVVMKPKDYTPKWTVGVGRS
jgi:hypothetical protein